MITTPRPNGAENRASTRQTNMIEKKTRGITREMIIETAFAVWGENGFHDTNLIDLARKLGITKTALYRHFTNKDDLLRSMEAWFLARFIGMNQEVMESGDRIDVDAFITSFTKAYFDFFSKHKGLYVYFIRMIMHKPITAHAGIVEVRDRIESILAAAFPAICNHISCDPTSSGLYLFMTVLFWIFLFIVPKPPGHFPIIIEKQGRQDDWLEQIASLCLRGVRAKTVPRPDDYDRIERFVAIRKDELPPADRIKRAIVDTIIDAGLEGATIDKIAASLNMSKSSLYFYFHNKDEMLSGAIESSQKHFIALLARKIAPLTSFPERSYAYMFFMASFMRMEPSMLLIFNWLRIQNLRIHLPPMDARSIDELFSFVARGAARGEIECGSLTPPAIGGFLHVLAFQSVIAVEQKQLEENGLARRLRCLHALFLRGLAGDHTNEQRTKKENRP